MLKCKCRSDIFECDFSIGIYIGGGILFHSTVLSHSLGGKYPKIQNNFLQGSLMSRHLGKTLFYYKNLKYQHHLT